MKTRDVLFLTLTVCTKEATTQGRLLDVHYLKGERSVPDPRSNLATALGLRGSSPAALVVLLVVCAVSVVAAGVGIGGVCFVSRAAKVASVSLAICSISARSAGVNGGRADTDTGRGGNYRGASWSTFSRADNAALSGEIASGAGAAGVAFLAAGVSPLSFSGSAAVFAMRAKIFRKSSTDVLAFVGAVAAVETGRAVGDFVVLVE